MHITAVDDRKGLPKFDKIFDKPSPACIKYLEERSLVSGMRNYTNFISWKDQFKTKKIVILLL